MGNVAHNSRRSPRSPRSLTGAVAGFDPSTATVAQVTDWVAEHPDQRDQIADLERNGKARVTLLAALDAPTDD